LFFSLLALFLVCPNCSRSETISDIYGRTLELPAKTERIIALGGSMMFVTYMEAVDLVVGVEEIDKTVISKPYIIVNAEKVKDLPVIGSGGSKRLFNIEEMISLRPDVVFLLAMSRSEADDLQRKLRQPVVALSFYGQANEYGEENFLKSLQIVGRALNKEARAQKLTDYILSLKKELHYDPPPDKRATAYVGGLSSRGNRDITSTTAISMPMDMAGIDNIMAGSAPGAAFISKEHLLSLNPALFFIDANGLELIREAIRSDPSYYRRLTALSRGDAYLTLPHTSYLHNAETLYANAFFMAKTAYPDQYPDLDPIAKSDEIFSVFDGQKLYQRLQNEFGGYGHLKLEGTDLALTKH
jgi:iron complex transport system substrate-binding protein